MFCLFFKDAYAPMKWTINFFKKTLGPQAEGYQLSYPDLDRSPVAKTIKAFNRIILEIL